MAAPEALVVSDSQDVESTVASDSEDVESTVMGHGIARQGARHSAFSCSSPMLAVEGAVVAAVCIIMFLSIITSPAGSGSPPAQAYPEEPRGLAASDSYKSVMGGPLASCSKAGTAMTGFTRDGHCVDSGNDDAGSHHICIQMKSDFCKVTGQPNWCVEKMQCMDDPQKDCPIGNWCVCQWAFATYIEMAGGCDQILDLECDATNLAAFHAYQESNDPSHKAALACIQEKCGLQ